MATELSPSPAERARKSLQGVIAALQEPGRAVALAAAMGVSESTVSRVKNERLEESLLFLAHLGFKVVPSDFRCVDPESYAFLTKTHERIMRSAPQLIWDRDDA